MLDLKRSGIPEVNIDIPAVVSQFLSELSTLDLVVELVQNDLDAGATRTIIAFEAHQLVCFGNGKKIDQAGWKRLRYVLGAGTKVDAKKDGIGSKNHGLRSAFLLGDQIIVQSGGYRIDLTVRGDESNPDSFYPAVWPEMRDPTGPETGTRITVTYRDRPLNVPERNALEPIAESELEKLFEEAVDHTADRFLCASSPCRKWHYEFYLSKGMRKISYFFESSPMKGPAGYFLRTCKKSNENEPRKIVERRICSAFELQLHESDHAKVPKLFRRGKRILGELGWRVTSKFGPESGGGRLRYPIAYPHEHLSNQWGFDISGPFISGRARHSVSDDVRNGLIIETGRKAFVEVMARHLIPVYGAEALVLVTNSEHGDQGAENVLASELVKAGAIPMFVPLSAKAAVRRKFRKADPNEVVWLPAPTYAPTMLSKSLALVSASQGQTLHPSTPQSFVNAISRLPSAHRPAIKQFSELDAAEAVLMQTDSRSPPDFDRWLALCVTTMGQLDLARLHNKLTTDFLKKLREKGVLPTTHRCVAIWSYVRRSAKPPPEVPGVEAPPLLHPSLYNFAILKAGTGKVPVFKVNDHLSDLDFSSVAAEGRLNFFNWLEKGFKELTPKTLTKIASFPIWPANDGSFHALVYFCRPKGAYLRDVMAEIRSPASEMLHAFLSPRNNSKRGLKLRKVPSNEEILEWHTKRMKFAEQAFNAKRLEDLQSIVDETEEILAHLESDGFISSAVIAAHRSLSSAGALVPIQSLHVPTPRVIQTELLSEDLAAGRHHTLYKHFGSSVVPSKAAVLRAFRSAPTSSSLIPRLEAYKAAGGELGDLSNERIVQVGDQLLAPNTLCFPSTTDWWGDWKIPLEKAPDVPEHVSLLVESGVVRSALREELSLAFFDWIAEQPNSVQRKHRQQIVRHWTDRRFGPLRWIEHWPQKKCIPVHDKDSGFELLNKIQVTALSKRVFLPDFDELARKVLNASSRVRFAIIDAPRVDGSIMEHLKLAGVPSLRAVAGRPVRLMTTSETNSDPTLDHELALVQSTEVLKTLPRRLPHHDVPGSALRHGWRRLASELSGVRTASGLTAVYRILNREYEVAVNSGIDEPTYRICVSGKADRKMGFYAALVGHLFETGCSKLFEYGLMQAVHTNLRGELFEDDYVVSHDEFSDL